MTPTRSCYNCRGSGTVLWQNTAPWDGMSKTKKSKRPCPLCKGAKTVVDTDAELDRAILYMLDEDDGFSAAEVAGLIGKSVGKVAGRLRSLARRKLVKGLAPAPWEGQWPGAAYGVWMWYRNVAEEDI